MTNVTQTADFLAESVVAIGGGEKFVLMSKTGGEGLPLVAWRLKNQEEYDGIVILVSFVYSPLTRGFQNSQSLGISALRAGSYLVSLSPLGGNVICARLTRRPRSIHDGTECWDPETSARSCS